MSPQTSTEPKTYYSAAAGLIVNINVGRRIIEPGGTTAMVDQKIAEFQPIGDGFGRLATSDPEVIAKLDARALEHGDVFDGTEYARRTTPAEVRLKLAEQENTRIMNDYNRLLAKVQAEEKTKK
jgi:hypothetical protein